MIFHLSILVKLVKGRHKVDESEFGIVRYILLEDERVFGLLGIVLLAIYSIQINSTICHNDVCETKSTMRDVMNACTELGP